MKKIFLFLGFTGILFGQSVKDVKVYIYNQNFAVCNELREIEIQKGKSEIIFKDIPKFIEISSINLLPVEKGKFKVLEQIFNYDVYNSEKVLSKNIGEKIEIITKDGQIYQGILLFYEAGNIGIEREDGIILISRENIKEVKLAKKGDFSYKPYLKFLVENEKSGIHKFLFKYITSNINWKADYIGEYDEEKNNLNLKGNVTIENKSGIDYKNAEIELIAGDVKKLKEYTDRRQMDFEAKALAVQEVPSFEESPVFEYHRYKLKGKTDLNDGETKQINFIKKDGINVEKKYVYDGSTIRYYHYENWRNLKYNENVEVIIEFKNEDEPMPKGKVKIFKKEENCDIFIGENIIPHTPKGEKIKLSLGNAFDVKGERRIINHERISQVVYRDTYEIKIKNFKKEDTFVDVIEHLYGTWEITEKTHNFDKVDAFTIKFPVKVKSEGEEIIRYTVITKF